MNKNMKRAQAPKRFNRHDSKIMSKRALSGFGMKAPRTRDDRASMSMVLRSGTWEG